MDDSPPWADLHPDIIDLIQRDFSFLDHVRFGAVCSSWRAAAVRKPHHQALQLPWILLPYCPDRPRTWAFLSMLEGHRYSYPCEVEVDHYYADEGDCPVRCFGASMGYLMFTSEWGNILKNVFTGKEFSLPHTRPGLHVQDVASPYYYSKAILSAYPTDANIRDRKCIVVAIAGGDDANADGPTSTVTYCKPGDDNWLFLNEVFHNHGQNYRPYDIIFYEGLLYCLAEGGMLLTFNFDPQGEPTFRDWYHPGLDEHIRFAMGTWGTSAYLVESQGELLMVIRVKDILGNSGDSDPVVHDYTFLRTTEFHVFRLERGTKEWKWIHITNIGSEMLFVGTGYSRSFSAGVFPGYRPNHIYFTDDSTLDVRGYYGPYPDLDWGFFGVEDGTIDRFLPNESQYLLRPPLWLSFNI